MFDEGRAVSVIDGQNIRAGLSKDLGFSDQDRSENLRRSVEVARFLNDSGMICICAFVAPNAEVRQLVREAVGGSRFLLAYLSTPVDICRQRDRDGIYAAVDAGEITNFPGITTPYDPPDPADLVLPNHEWSVDQCVDALIELLRQKRRID